MPADEPAVSLKSTSPCPGRFHRFQRIQTDRSTLSTAALYDLYTRYGQSVDKKALLPCLRNYPQVPPQAGRPIYRGFQVHKFLLNQSDKVFFHEIWLYHHHHALDLYPDLEARLPQSASNLPCGQRRLQREVHRGAMQDHRSLSGQIWGQATSIGSCTLDFRSIATRHCYDPAILFSTIETNIPERQRISTEPIDGSDVVPRTASSLCSTWNLQKNAREDPGRRSVPRGTAAVRDAAASPRGATSRCWTHVPAPRSWNRAAG